VDYEITVEGKKVGVVVPTTLEDAVEATFKEYQEVIRTADLITNSDRIEELKAQEVIIEKEHNDLTKTELAIKFDIESNPVLLNDELTDADKKQNFLSGIRNHYYLDRSHYAEAHGISNIKRDDSLNFAKIPKDQNLKIQLLIQIHSQELIASAGESLHREHPLVKKIITEAQAIEAKVPGVISRHLKINVPKSGSTKDDPMKFIDSLALKLAITKKEKGG
jgi:hypothetical protein